MTIVGDPALGDPPEAQPAEVLATLTTGAGVPVQPTLRYGPDHVPYGDGAALPDARRPTLSCEPLVYGLYARRTGFLRWVNPSVRTLLANFPETLGDGGTAPDLADFLVADPDDEDPWVLLYVGQSGMNSRPQRPRVENYFGTGGEYTGGFGQSTQAVLTLAFTDGVDTRYGGGAGSLSSRIIDGLGIHLNQRFRDMGIAYVQVVCNVVDGVARTTRGEEDDADALHDAHGACRDIGVCAAENEKALTAMRINLRAPTGRPWPEGARPVLNAMF